MKDQTNFSSMNNNVNIDECIKNLQTTIKKIKTMTESIKETWFLGLITDKPVVQSKAMLINQLNDIHFASQSKKGYDLLEIKAKINSFMIMIAPCLSSDKFQAFSESQFVNELNKHITDIDHYIYSLKDKYHELEQENKTLLNAIDSNSSTQMTIKSLLIKTDMMEASNLRLVKNVAKLKKELSAALKDNNELKNENENLITISDKKTENYLKEKNRLKNRIRELEQKKYSTPIYTLKDDGTGDSHNSYHLFSNDSYSQSDSIGVLNDMQKTLYNPHGGPTRF